MRKIRKPAILLSAIIISIMLFPAILMADYYEQGCHNYIRKNYDAAREMFLKDVELNDNGDSYYFLGEIEKNEGNLEKAEEYYRESTQKNISKKYLKLAYWNLVVIKEQRGRYEEMVILCREFWKRLNDDGAKSRVESLINKLLWTDDAGAIELYNEGMEYKSKKMYEEAKNAFYNAIQYAPSFLAPRFELALMYYREDNINYVLHYLNQVIDEIPFYGELHLLLGDIYYRKKLYYYSIDHYNRAMKFAFLDKDSEYTLRLQRGTSYFKINDFEKAVEDIYKAQEIKSNAIEPMLLLSAINIKNEHYEEALESLKKAEKIRPEDPEILFQIGSIYYKMEDSRYVAFFDQLLGILNRNKKSIPRKYVNAFIILARESFEKREYEKTAKILEIIPDNLKDYELTLLSAKTYHIINEPAKAIENFEKLSLTNDQKYLLAVDYAKNEMYDKAKNILLELSYQHGYMEKARLDYSLRKIALDIEREKIRKEEEERQRIEEKRKRIEEEKRRLEEERKRLEEEKRRIEAEKEAQRIAEEKAREIEEEKEKIEEKDETSEGIEETPDEKTEEQTAPSSGEEYPDSDPPSESLKQDTEKSGESANEISEDGESSTKTETTGQE